MIEKNNLKINDISSKCSKNKILSDKQNSFGKIVKFNPKKNQQDDHIISKQSSSLKRSVLNKLIGPQSLSFQNKIPAQINNDNSVSINKYKALSKILNKNYQQKNQKVTCFNKPLQFLNIKICQESDTQELETPKFLIIQSKDKGINKKNKFQGKIIKIPKSKQQFIKNLKKQIKLQQKFRNIKHQINPQQKQKYLGKINKLYGITIDIVTLQPQEYDPFFKHQQHNNNMSYLMQSLVDAYHQAERHWQQNMKQKYDKTVIKQFLRGPQELTQIITLKRFAKYTQDFLSNEYIIRNKDIFAIYKRIQPLFSKQNFTKQLSSSIHIDK